MAPYPLYMPLKPSSLMILFNASILPLYRLAEAEDDELDGDVGLGTKID